jgi:deazaflavin-dependent oxidoreductase (nitroreductase family)
VDPRYTLAFDRRFGRWFYPAHRRVYQLSRGLIGHSSPMGPMLLLTTTGRRSAEPRTNPLLYMPDGKDYVVVASNGGRDRPPAWLLNLEATPVAVIQVRRTTSPVTAEILRGAEAAPLWPRLTEHYNGWSYYQQLTEREIPVVRLETSA